VVKGNLTTKLVVSTAQPSLDGIQA